MLDQLHSIEDMFVGFEKLDGELESELMNDSVFSDEKVDYPWESQQAKVEEESSVEGNGDQIFVDQLHSAIRWNRSKEKWTELLDMREDSCNLVDHKNGNTALHLAAQVGQLSLRVH